MGVVYAMPYAFQVTEHGQYGKLPEEMLQFSDPPARRAESTAASASPISAS